MRYYVLLPQGYDDNQAARYPVLYYLHGMSGDPNEWLRYGVQEAAASLMGDGTVLPFIIVLPEGDQGYWVDQVNGGPQYATYVARDVVAEIDAHYRTLPQRQYRAIGGLSMGAHGALQIALNHPDVFSIVGAHSPSFRTGADIPAYFGTGADLAQRDPLQLVVAHPDIARTLTIWLDYGPDDYFVQGQNQLEQELVAEGIPHEFHQYPGGHTTEYWSAHVGDYLHFYSASFANAR
jgi:enterochelin esterase-like enzyme